VLSKEDNDRLTRVGFGTPMGALMRRYWIPAAFTFEEVAGSGVTVPNISPVVIPDLPPLIPDPSFPEAIECHVPRLKGKTLKQAKPVLAAAHCNLGRVTKRKGLKAKRARVVNELPPAGSRAPAHASVQVRLG